MADYGYWQGAERASGRALGVGMDLIHLKAQQQYQNQQLAMQQQQADRQKEMLAMQKREHESKMKQEAYDTELLDVDETLSKIGITRQAERDELIRYAGPAVMQGVSGRRMIQRNHGMKIWEKFQTDDDLALRIDTIRAKSIPGEVAQIEAALQDEKLKPEQAEKLQAQRKALIGELTAAETAIKRLTKEKDKFSDPYYAGGARLQKNLTTNEEKQVSGRPPVGEGETAKVNKMDNKARQIEKDAAAEAKRRTMLKFNIQPAVTVDAEGNPSVTWPANRPEVFQYYMDEQKKITDDKIKNAVKRGVLSKDYMPEEAAYKTPDDVKAAFQAGNITEAEAIKILQSNFGMK